MDKDHIAELIGLGNSIDGIAAARKIAAKALKDFPHNGCAVHLSALLQLSGIDVPMTAGAGKLASILGSPLKKKVNRNWTHIARGKQEAGDVGVTFDLGGNPGADHIYLVVNAVDKDEMVIADNQSSKPHQRFASGKGGTTPTEYFLRAPDA